MAREKNEGRAIPAVLKVMRGTYRKDRDAGKVSVPDVIKSVPVPPDGYSEKTKDMWYKICTTLISVGLLQDIGLNQIEIYCDQFEIYRDAKEKVMDKGSVIKITSRNGQSVIKRNPYVEVMGAAFVIMNQISDRFGFSPLSQSRIKNISSPVGGKSEGEADEFDNIGK